MKLRTYGRLQELTRLIISPIDLVNVIYEIMGESFRPRDCPAENAGEIDLTVNTIKRTELRTGIKLFGDN